MSKKSIGLSAAILAVLLVSVPLLGWEDSAAFLKWCLMVTVLGAGFYPLTAVLFRNFSDHGWIFSQVLGIAISGFAAFALICAGICRFQTVTVWGISILCAAVCWMLYLKKKPELPPVNTDVVLGEELIFLAFFLLWTYIAAFHPAAKGTEKFMDYGFMAAMMRSDTLPAKDLWFAGENINYYYGGQYYAVFLTRLSFTNIQQTYNLMRTLVAGYAFAMPAVITYHMLSDLSKTRRKMSSRLAVIGGLLSGAAVSLAGNMHYVLYGLLGNVFQLDGYEDYWFPSSTRYIGHNPENTDQCIHEYPSYSFILGDLHAHMVNLIFVFTAVTLLYAWVKDQEKRKGEAFSWKKLLLCPHVLLMGFFTGIYRFTNYWDFVIYLTVFMFVLFLILLRRYKEGVFLRNALAFCAVVAEVFVIGVIVALPFTSTFVAMYQGIALCYNHTAFYQLVVLWGLPTTVVIVFFVAMVTAWRRRREAALFAVADGGWETEVNDHQPADENQSVDADWTVLTETAVDLTEAQSLGMENSRRERGLWGFLRQAALPDLFALILGICAIGLVMMPEIVFVKDIYGENSARANTMFKLTYQAYILFGTFMGYALMRLISRVGAILYRILAWILTGLLCLTILYFGYAVNCWFGNVLDHSRYQGLDCTAYLTDEYPQDAAAIQWLEENIEGNPVVLEANGDSYSDYCRVSAMTGLPTVLGWYVHEWLWRDSNEIISILNQRSADVETIYTSGDQETVEALLEQYDVSYIFVGSCEREKYENLNEEMLLSLGTVVYSSVNSGTPDGAYIIQVGGTPSITAQGGTEESSSADTGVAPESTW